VIIENVVCITIACDGLNIAPYFNSVGIVGDYEELEVLVRCIGINEFSCQSVNDPVGTIIGKGALKC